MFKYKLNLQLFDGEGAAAAGAASVETAGEGTSPAAGGEKQTDAAVDPKAREAEYKRLISTDYKDVHAKYTQELINKRFKETKTLEDKLNKTSPILGILSQKYGISDGDPDKLIQAIEADDALFEEQAIEKGYPDVKAYKETLRTERQVKELLQEKQIQREESERQERMTKLFAEADSVKTAYPNFDLNAESQNRDFASLVSAGIPMKTAYEVVHKDDIISGAMAYTAQKVAENVSTKRQEKAGRPSENGLGGQASASTKIDVSNMTSAQYRELEKRILNGERIEL